MKQLFVRLQLGQKQAKGLGVRFLQLDVEKEWSRIRKDMAAGTLSITERLEVQAGEGA